MQSAFSQLCELDIGPTAAGDANPILGPSSGLGHALALHLSRPSVAARLGMESHRLAEFCVHTSRRWILLSPLCECEHEELYRYGVQVWSTCSCKMEREQRGPSKWMDDVGIGREDSQCWRNTVRNHVVIAVGV